jgi:hypothetical protein
MFQRKISYVVSRNVNTFKCFSKKWYDPNPGSYKGCRPGFPEQCFTIAFFVLCRDLPDFVVCRAA